MDNNPLILPHPNMHLKAEFAPDGGLLAVMGFADTTSTYRHVGPGANDYERVEETGEDRFSNVLVWNAEAGKMQARFLETPIETFAFSSTQAVIATAHGSTICLWDAANGQLRRTIERKEAESRLFYRGVTFDAQSERLAVCRSGAGSASVDIFDSESGAWIQTLEKADDGEVFRKEDGTTEVYDIRSVFKVYFVPGGTRLIGTSYYYDAQDRAYLWDLETGEKLATFLGNPPNAETIKDAEDDRVEDEEERNPDYVEKVVISPDGRFLAAASGQATLWECRETGGKAGWEFRHRCEGHARGVHELAFSPDSRTLATLSTETHFVEDDVAPSGYKVRLWDVLSGQERALLPIPGKFFSMAFTPGSRVLATMSGEVKNYFENDASEYLLCLWDTVSGQKLAQYLTPSRRKNSLYYYPFGSMRFSPDGRRLAVCHLYHAELWTLNLPGE